MQGHSIVYRLDVVGQKGDPGESCYYIFELVKNDGSVRKIWAYGIDQIMEPTEPDDLSPIRDLFPHLPNEVFVPRTNKPVDILGNLWW